ncbi:hypothetical protein ATANTOWER_003265 [Ataeniobius toweri]|uniref:Uncharacterized protein n=1 Tax=Ataeniobius toweri TaxID=208326 RepID=A0ABU7AAG6_9TELE|nr:hypothetical protein [Ataeniobius toweri]
MSNTCAAAPASHTLHRENTAHKHSLHAACTQTTVDMTTESCSGERRVSIVQETPENSGGGLNNLLDQRLPDRLKGCVSNQFLGAIDFQHKTEILG